MLRILLCANHLGTTPNGPAKFANLLLEQQRLHPNPEVDIRVMTPDLTPSKHDGERVYRVRTSPEFSLGTPLREHRRAVAYARRTEEIRQTDFPFDVLVFNDLTTAYRLPANRAYRVVGLINDHKNIDPKQSEQNSWFSWLSRVAVEQQQRRAVRKVDLVVTNSHSLSAIVERAFGLPESKVRVMYKAVRMNAIAYAPPQPNEGMVKVLFVKTDFRIGGLPELYQALNTLSDTEIELTVIGPPPETLHLLTQRFGPPAGHLSVNMRGRRSQEEVYAALRETQLFCVPARQEPLGVANIEAMAHGVPVVTTDVGGIPEVTDNGRNAWVCPAGDPVALAAAIRDCLANPGEAALRSRRARQYVADKFAPRSTYARFVELCTGQYTD